MIIIRRQTFTMPLADIPKNARQLGMTIRVRLVDEFTPATTIWMFLPRLTHSIAGTIMRMSNGEATLCSTISEQRVAVVMKHFR